MREIKYRAYIKEFWKIYEVISIMTKKFDWEDFLRVFINKEVKEWGPANYRIDWVDNILMQYTGLKDKNNIPIFEGDVVKNEQAWCIGNEFPIWDIVYDEIDASFIWDRWWNGDYMHWLWPEDIWYDNKANYLEVIWNIYEDPSLFDNK